MSALSDLLNQANTEGWSHRRIRDAAERLGHKISNDAVYKMLIGRHPVPANPDHLLAMSEVLGVAYRRLRVAGEVPADLGPWTPPRQSNALSEKERDALALIIKAMARGRGLSERSVSTPDLPVPAPTDIGDARAKKTSVPKVPRKRAAKKGPNTGRAIREQADTEAETPPQVPTDDETR